MYTYNSATIAQKLKEHNAQDVRREFLRREKIMAHRQLPSLQLPFSFPLSSPFLFLSALHESFYLRRDFVATTINCFKVRLDWERLISLAALRPVCSSAHSRRPLIL